MCIRDSVHLVFGHRIAAHGQRVTVNSAGAEQLANDTRDTSRTMEGLAKIVKHFLHLAVIRYVALDSIRLATGGADLFDRVVCAFDVNLEYIDKRTLFGQGECDRLANSRSRAGYNSGLSH